MIVIDTHVLIWSVQDDPKLGKIAGAAIEKAAAEATILIPAICAWELGFVEKRGIVTLPGGALRWMRNILNAPGFTLAALEPAIAIESVAMTWLHKDPADRMIVATARHWQMPLITADEKILDYAAAGHVEAMDARQ